MKRKASGWEAVLLKKCKKKKRDSRYDISRRIPWRIVNAGRRTAGYATTVCLFVKRQTYTRINNESDSDITTTRKGSLDMNTKEKHLPVFAGNGVDEMSTREKRLPVLVEDGCDGVFHEPKSSECSGELSIGPVSFKGCSRSSDNSGSVLGGVLAGGAVAIGAVAVTLVLLGAGKNS